MCYVTFELLFKSGQGLLVCFLKKKYKFKSSFSQPQAEGNVNSCLYSRGRGSNKSHEEYDAGEVQHYSAITKMKHKCVIFAYG